jgi:hypothetical protein
MKLGFICDLFLMEYYNRSNEVILSKGRRINSKRDGVILRIGTAPPAQGEVWCMVYYKATAPPEHFSYMKI